MFTMDCAHLKKGIICDLKSGIFNVCDVAAAVNSSCPGKTGKTNKLTPSPPDARRTNYLMPAPPPPPHRIIGEDIKLPAVFGMFTKKKKESFRLEANGLDNQEEVTECKSRSECAHYIPIKIKRRSKGDRMLIAVAKDHDECILDAVFTKTPELARVYWHGKGIHPHKTVYYTDKDLENHPTGVIPLLPKRVIALLHEVQYGV